jgi:hypothetical protein
MSNIPNYIQSSNSNLDHDPEYLGPNLTLQTNHNNQQEDQIKTSFPVPRAQPVLQYKPPIQQTPQTPQIPQIPMNYFLEEIQKVQDSQQAAHSVYVMPHPEDENLDMTDPEDDYAEFNLMHDISHYMHFMRPRMK